MNLGTVVSVTNFLSRWALFIAVAYKAYKTRDKGWVLLSTAFFINALDVESYIFTPLGINMAPAAYRVASQIPNFFIAALLIWGALHLKYTTSKLKHVVYISVFLAASYVWLFLVAANLFHDDFAVESSFPIFSYSFALVYFGWILMEGEVSTSGVDSLFPWGLILLGLLNFTYPVTRNVDWFVPIAFSLGALFRLIAAVGALKFVFIPISPADPNALLPRPIPPGTFLYPSRGAVVKEFGNIEELPNLLAITRGDLGDIRNRLNPNALVFWITRVAEGEIHDSPRIYAISPTKIGILTDLITKAVESGYRVLYIDAVEYLIIENGFERTMKFLLNVKDRVLVANGTVILVTDPSTLDPAQRKILEREFRGE